MILKVDGEYIGNDGELTPVCFARSVKVEFVEHYWGWSLIKYTFGFDRQKDCGAGFGRETVSITAPYLFDMVKLLLQTGNPIEMTTSHEASDCFTITVQVPSTHLFKDARALPTVISEEVDKVIHMVRTNVNDGPQETSTA